MKTRLPTIAAALAAPLVLAATQVPPKAPAVDAGKPIEEATLSPIFAADFACSQHFEGQLPYMGDALGSDCLVQGGLSEDEASGFMREFRTDGRRNEDWYGWREPVLSPLDGVVERVNINPQVNEPGSMGKPPASFVLLLRDDGVHVMLAHVADVSVKAGDKVSAGQRIAVVGNNGFARAPHIHVGAWRDKTPLQVRFDLRALAALRKKEG